jgi:hypothetical protein
MPGEAPTDRPPSNWPNGDHRVAIVLNRELMFGSRIRSALAQLGLEARFVRDADKFVAALAEAGEAGAIGIIDMNGPVAWDTIREAILADAGGTPTLAFGPHVDAAGRRAAKAAGVTRIVSNGQFSADMAGLIDRYRRR